MSARQRFVAQPKSPSRDTSNAENANLSPKPASSRIHPPATLTNSSNSPRPAEPTNKTKKLESSDATSSNTGNMTSGIDKPLNLSSLSRTSKQKQPRNTQPKKRPASTLIEKIKNTADSAGTLIRSPGAKSPVMSPTARSSNRHSLAMSTPSSNSSYVLINNDGSQIPCLSFRSPPPKISSRNSHSSPINTHIPIESHPSTSQHALTSETDQSSLPIARTPAPPTFTPSTVQELMSPTPIPLSRQPQFLNSMRASPFQHPQQQSFQGTDEPKEREQPQILRNGNENHPPGYDFAGQGSGVSNQQPPLNVNDGEGQEQRQANFRPLRRANKRIWKPSAEEHDEEGFEYAPAPSKRYKISDADGDTYPIHAHHEGIGLAPEPGLLDGQQPFLNAYTRVGHGTPHHNTHQQYRNQQQQHQQMYQRTPQDASHYVHSQQQQQQLHEYGLHPAPPVQTQNNIIAPSRSRSRSLSVSHTQPTIPSQHAQGHANPYDRHPTPGLRSELSQSPFVSPISAHAQQARVRAHNHNGREVEEQSALYRLLGVEMDTYLESHADAYEAAKRRWTECSIDEWTRGAEEMSENFNKMLDFVKGHMTTKMALFASLHVKVSKHKTMLEERDVMLKGIREKLVADSGAVLGGRGPRGSSASVSGNGECLS